MKRVFGKNRRISRRALVKAFLLLAFVLAAVSVLRLPGVRHLFTPESLGHLLEVSGIWAPIVFVFFYATCVCLLLPASLPTLLGAALFGAYWGFLYAWIGAVSGASAAFFIGRTLGRDFAASLVGDRLAKYDEAIRRKGFATVLYLRLINFPFTPLNFGMGLTKVHFRDFFFGTGLGILVGLYVLTFLGGALREAWTRGDWRALICPRLFFAAGILGFSLLLPGIIEKIRGKRESGS